MGIFHSLSFRLSSQIALFFSLSFLFTTITFAGVYNSTGSGNYHSNSTWTLISGTGGLQPGANDEANILAGHLVYSLASIHINRLKIQTGGNLTLRSGGSTIHANKVNVLAGGTIQGFDNGSGPGGRVDITNVGTGFALLNEGVIRGGNPGGYLFISSANGSDLPCASNGASVTGLNGRFLGGSTYGGVYIVSENLTMTNTLIQGGSGSAPNMAAGPVYLGGIGITLDGITTVLSGSNSAPSGTAGTVKIVASNCNNGLGTLLIDAGVTVTVGTPVVAACPGVLLYAGFSSTVLGTVGPMGAINCMYWDPPNLSLAGDAKMSAVNMDIAGETLTAGSLNPGTLALEVQDTLTISVNTLDLTGLVPDAPYFIAGQQILINAQEILLDEGVELNQLMEPEPHIQEETKVQALSVTPSVVANVSQGANPAVPIQIVSVGNTDIGNLRVRITDSAGWLSGGSYNFSGPLAAGESLNYQAIINVPTGTKVGSRTKLYVSTSVEGQPSTTETSVFTFVEY